ncbi:hypothetical protein [Nitrososphaera viennensis]|uniref:Uncharacterized protein n=2 Tax=Nitrososphaera viennensis TaxID=1034015 RepID=A0A060HTF8_9ARCH|nr:hypothetical protein [Nitrososphaera viennensis]AIC16751.1 hypothetical protein NVIE_024860 [Nitrososphaera viennensis EN76]UVS68665.1 hypothetical protein NWT39_12260 [Nitrososphaera viennensis]
MSNSRRDASQKDKDSGTHQMSSQWAEIIGQLFDRLKGKGASVTYTFDNLVIDMPKAQGPDGQDLGAARWTVNGKVVVTAEAHRIAEEEEDRQRTLAASTS